MSRQPNVIWWKSNGWYRNTDEERNPPIRLRNGGVPAPVQSDYSQGVQDFARNCITAIQMIKDGKATCDETIEWLRAVIKNDAAYLTKQNEIILRH